MVILKSEEEFLMDKKMKQNLILIAFGVTLFAGLMNFHLVCVYIQKVGRIFLPVIVGLIVAFILNVPFTGFENLYRKLFKKISVNPREGAIRGLSLLSTLGVIIFVIILVATMVIPELVSSIKSVYLVIEEKSPVWLSTLSAYGIDTTWITKQLSAIRLENIDFQHIFKNVMSGAGNVLNSALGVATSTINIFVTGAFALVISIYILLGKKTLCIQCKKLLYAHTKTSVADSVCRISRLISETYSRFLSGQCMEAVILGIMITISFSIFRLPYASLIGVLTAVLSFIPYIGAFSACFIGVLLVLLINPFQALISLIVYQVVQFIENQFVYPRVVGGSVGLAPLWTLLAVLIGGNLFGILGMIFFIPLTAVFYQLLKEYTNKKLAKKNLDK